ncbi:RimK family alpha-L-glutamate ligase [Haloferax sp. AB510]|uniref:RimK family alpha-L-glutamate ligase n=1 Tax=Haloferax sp. AB510 TaxID=2934172 RepID=UPI00209C13FC|nr:RimK family alpha-L-glutamate ligase [Haloferax sp. AB510]MCO8265343.1 RimK family alpha-L-glutamate ligase [Haloferax sp. AB510]
MGGDEPTVTVGILGFHDSRETKAISNAVTALGHEAVWLHEEAVGIDVSPSGVALDPDVDVVVNRLLLSKSTTPLEDLSIASCYAAVRPVLNDPRCVLFAVHKHATASRLAAAGVPVPHTYMATADAKLNAARDGFGTPVVYKTAVGTNGGGTWLVDHDRAVSATVDGRRAFIQEYIDAGDHRRDLRVYVVDDEVVGAMYRYAPDGDWRTNVALGGDVLNATDEMPEEARETALYTAEVMEMDYVGVDLVEGEDGWFVLEANPTAGFKGLYQATGKSPAPHIAKLAIERAGGEVDETRVEELSATLDDSVPSCAPNESPIIDGEAPIIGYIEEVVVNGTSGSQQTLAKSDTGATRTSIDTSLAAEIGAGPIKSMTRVKSGSLKGGKARPVVDLVIGIGGTQHTVTASVEDRSHMDYPLLLGRDILEHYRVDVRRRANADRNDSDDEEEELLEE